MSREHGKASKPVKAAGDPGRSEGAKDEGDGKEPKPLTDEQLGAIAAGDGGLVVRVHSGPLGS
jgi:hypothetical protein